MQIRKIALCFAIAGFMPLSVSYAVNEEELRSFFTLSSEFLKKEQAKKIIFTNKKLTYEGFDPKDLIQSIKSAENSLERSNKLNQIYKKPSRAIKCVVFPNEEEFNDDIKNLLAQIDSLETNFPPMNSLLNIWLYDIYKKIDTKAVKKAQSFFTRLEETWVKADPVDGCSKETIQAFHIQSMFLKETHPLLQDFVLASYAKNLKKESLLPAGQNSREFFAEKIMMHDLDCMTQAVLDLTVNTQSALSKELKKPWPKAQVQKNQTLGEAFVNTWDSCTNVTKKTNQVKQTIIDLAGNALKTLGNNHR